MEVKGFRPFMFSNDVDNFWSPPFDSISPEEERDLKAHEFNITHITLPHGSDGINASSRTFRSWVKHGILSQLEKDSIILLQQKFMRNGKAKERFGIVALTRVFPQDGSIKPHEMTFEGPRKNREEVMRGLGLIPEPIFLISPGNAFMDAMLTSSRRARKVHVFKQPEDVENTIYVVDTIEDIKYLIESLRQQVAIVADGHHRLAAIKEIAATDHGGWEYALAYIASSEDPALFVSGIHRIVKANILVGEFIKSMKEFFNVQEAVSFDPEKGISIYINGGFYSIEPKPDFLSYKSEFVHDPGLFVRKEILERIIGLDRKQIETGIIYSHDIDYAINMVNEGKAGLVILMPDWDKKLFTEVVSAGHLLSQKSTYFYPKPPSGVAIYKPLAVPP